MVVILTPIVLMVVGIPDCIVTSPLTVGFEGLFLVTVLKPIPTGVICRIFIWGDFF